MSEKYKNIFKPTISDYRYDFQADNIASFSLVKVVLPNRHDQTTPGLFKESLWWLQSALRPNAVLKLYKKLNWVAKSWKNVFWLTIIPYRIKNLCYLKEYMVIINRDFRTIDSEKSMYI